MRPRRAPAAVAVVALLAFTGACGDDDGNPPDSPRGAEDPTVDDADEGVDLEGEERDSGSESDVEPRTDEGGVPTTDY